jgi:polyvinyl alcohol dehydrogenase (cytochrome)
VRPSFLLPVLIGLAVGVGAGLAAAATPGWTTYRHDGARSGIDPDSTIPVTPSQSWQTPALDGEVYGQPLVYGSDVYVATENDSVYALDASTGAVMWSTHLATPEASSMAPCGDISPSIGITSTPVIDPATNRIYAVGAVSDGVHASSVQHELFALDLSSGQQLAGFPVAVDPTFPSGGTPRNQLQRPGLALDQGRILIGYGGNAGDCNTYWGWLVSAPESGGGALSSFQADPHYDQGAVWAAGNAPAIDSSGNIFVATGNGTSTDPSNPDYGDAVVKLNASAQVLDWWAPPNWKSLDSSDGDLGSSMPTLLPAGYVFQSGKDGNGYVLNGASLGNVSAPAASLSCGGGSFGGSVYDPGDSTLYATCGGLKAFSLTPGSPPSLAPKAGFSAPSGAKGPPMVSGGLVWATNYSSGTLYGIDPASGAVRAQFAIPEAGSEVNHFASPSAGGGRLFVGSGDQVTAYTVAQAPPPPPPRTAPALSRLRVSPHRVSLGRHRHRFKATISYTLTDAATVTLTVKHRVRDRKGHRRWVRVRGKITLTGHVGANKFTFHGRIGGHKLGPGSYRLAAVPSAGGTTGTIRTATLVVLR